LQSPQHLRFCQNVPEYANCERVSRRRLERSCSGKPLGRAVRLGVGALILLPPQLLAQSFARKRLFCATLLSRLHVVAVFLDFFDDVFLLYLALKTTQCIFERLTFLNANFSHLVFTVLPLHVANIAINRIVLRWQPFISAYWQSLLADPSTEVKLCFFRNRPLFGRYGRRGTYC
jgi:hypothetical protein